MIKNVDKNVPDWNHQGNKDNQAGSKNGHCYKKGVLRFSIWIELQLNPATLHSRVSKICEKQNLDSLFYSNFFLSHYQNQVVVDIIYRFMENRYCGVSLYLMTVYPNRPFKRNLFWNGIWSLKLTWLKLKLAANQQQIAF